MNTKLKDGVRTSEFALVVVIAVLTQLNVLQVGNDRQKGYITGALGVAYAISRGLAKLFPPKDQAVPAAAGGDEDALPHIPAVDGPVPPDEGDKGSK